MLGATTYLKMADTIGCEALTEFGHKGMEISFSFGPLGINQVLNGSVSFTIAVFEGEIF